ncbi:MAG: MFS transporter, partial [Pseudomonadota bacterium]
MTDKTATASATPMADDTLPAWARSWPSWVQPYLRPEMASMLFLGFASGLPLYLVYQKTSFWMREEGVSLATIGFFFWVGMFYSFKFVWAPIADKVKIPWLTDRIGHRRSWMIAAIVGTVIALLLIASSDPSEGIGRILAGALLLSFSGATLDVSIDAWRIESAPSERQANMAASYSLGYRGALIFSNFGFVIASWLNWPAAFTVMAIAMGVTGALVLLIKEPRERTAQTDISSLPFFAGPWNAIAVATAIFVLSRVLKFFGPDHIVLDGLFVIGIAIILFGNLIFRGTTSSFIMRLALAGAGTLFVFARDIASLFMQPPEAGPPVFSLLVILISVINVALYGRLVYEAIAGNRRDPGEPNAPEGDRGKVYTMYATPFLQVWERFGKVIIPIFVFVMIYRTSDFTMGVMAIPLYA